MCCFTHQYRDMYDAGHGIPYTVAEDPKFVCQCKYGDQCMRRMTAEDFLCDWCRAKDLDAAHLGRALNGHQHFCDIDLPELAKGIHFP